MKLLNLTPQSDGCPRVHGELTIDGRGSSLLDPQPIEAGIEFVRIKF